MIQECQGQQVAPDETALGLALAGLIWSPVYSSSGDAGTVYCNASVGFRLPPKHSTGSKRGTQWTNDWR